MIKQHAHSKSMNEVHALMIDHSVFSVMAEMIVEILSVLFPVCNAE